MGGPTKEELLQEIHDAALNFQEEKSVELCQKALDAGIDAYSIIMQGLAAAMKTAGDLYEKSEYFVPELLLCSDAMYAGLEILRPHVKVNEHAVQGKIIMGVVEGDIHDIGKTLVKAMFEAAGWEIHDLGKDVKIETFVEEQKSKNADVIALSALMTTSMMVIPEVVKALREIDPNVIVLVGGAPLNAEIAGRYGADGYAPDAIAAVKEGERLLQQHH